MTIDEIKAKLEALKKEARGLYLELADLEAKEDRTPEDFKTMNTKMDQLDEKKKDIETHQAMLDTETRVQATKKEMARSAEKPPPTQETRVEYNEPEGFKTMGEFMQAVARAGLPQDGGTVAGQRCGTIDRRLFIGLSKEDRAAASGSEESQPSLGGFLLRPDFATEFLQNLYETGILMSKVRRGTLSTQATSVKINGVDEVSRVDGSRWGGVRAYWESGYYETNDTKVEVTVHAKKGMSYPDGDSWGHEYLVDICPKCFREKLVPWLNSQVQALKKRNTNHDCSMAQNMALIQTRLLR